MEGGERRGAYIAYCNITNAYENTGQRPEASMEAVTHCPVQVQVVCERGVGKWRWWAGGLLGAGCMWVGVSARLFSYVHIATANTCCPLPTPNPNTAYYYPPPHSGEKMIPGHLSTALLQPTLKTSHSSNQGVCSLFPCQVQGTAHRTTDQSSWVRQ